MESQELALFPLNTVLFPGMPLPLHIFEERYRRMIQECSDRPHPFGIVLIRSGQEVGAPAVPRDVGTSASIATLTRLEDGRINLLAIGQQRFRILELLREKPYLVGRVSMLEDEPGPACESLTPSLTDALLSYLDALFTLLDQEREPFELPTEAERLSYVTAAVLQIGLEEKQSLLELLSTTDRLREELQLLRREHEKLITVLRVKKHVGTITPFDSSRLPRFFSPN